MAEGGEDVVRQTSCLPINIEHLLSLQGVEKQRVEFKKAWHTRKQGCSYWQIVHTICAFANDFYNDNGGYIIIGVEEESDIDADRQAKLPPFGVAPSALDRIQKEIVGACSVDIKPNFTPVVSPEMCQEKHILVIWVRASECGAIQARESDKGEFRHYIRKGTETKKAAIEEVNQLIQQHSRTPFDDRMAVHTDGKPVEVKQIQWNLVSRFLDSVRSELHNQSQKKPDLEEIYEKMDLTTRYGDRVKDGKLQPDYVPRNFSLLFFNPDPYVFFRGAKIEIGHYSRDEEVIEEKQLSGPMDTQIRECLKYILTHTQEEVSFACVTYPERALREAVVNAAYHRGYEADQSDPIKVHMRPDCIEIISYPGPHPSLEPEHFVDGKKRPKVAARNRRIGDHLRQLKLAEARYTGVNTIFKTMKKNANSPPSFEFDSSYFQVTLPSHPKYITQLLLSDAENLVAKGETKEAMKLLDDFLKNYPDILSEVLFLKLVELHDWDFLHPDIQKHIAQFTLRQKREFEYISKRSPLLKRLQDLVNTKPLDVESGIDVIRSLVWNGSTLKELQHVVKIAIAFCQPLKEKSPPSFNLKNLQKGHKLFEAMGIKILSSSRDVAFEYGCCKYNIYNESVRQKVGTAENLSRYLQASRECVTQAIYLTNKENKPLLAKQWRQLGYINNKLLQLRMATTDDVSKCYANARELNPHIKIDEAHVFEEI